MTDKNRFFELLAKKKLNNATLSDITELNLLCKEEGIEQADFEDINNLLSLKFSASDLPSPQQTQISWDKFKSKVDFPGGQDIQIKKPRPKFTFPYTITSIAAILLVLVSVGIMFFIFSNDKSPSLNTVSTQNGSKSQVQLPDGTQVWLNGGSKITYNNQYGLKTRTITLVGEAYFDVKHNANCPFLIHTKNLDLKVLGTAFNVRAYKEEATSEATLIRGSLEVSFPSRPTEKIILKPTEKVSYLDNELLKSNLKNKPESAESAIKPMITLSKVDYLPKENVIEEIAWKENKLVFRSKAFEDLALNLERWYNVKIKIENNNIKEKKFTGIFKNESVFEALDALKQTYFFSYVFDKNSNTITII